MNTKMIRYLLGWVLNVQGVFMLIPCLTAAVYREHQGYAFLITLIFCLGLGVALTLQKPENTVFYAREGFCTVSLCWITLSFCGALPFYISREIPRFIDALFESVSGYTTTGASILSAVESLPQCMLIWRSLTHFIGGMGVLVFVLAILPLAGGHSFHLMRAESTGPSVSKLVPRLRNSAVFLYAIYISLTLIQIILLLIGGMPFFDAFNTALSTAGTGGFGIKNDSMAIYSPYLQTVTAVFMVLFGVNFSLYFFALRRQGTRIWRNEELRLYLGAIVFATAAIAWNTLPLYPSAAAALKDAFFQVGSIITSTGYSTVDFNLWPPFSKMILVMLMFIGACAGSTGGGLKCSRILLMFKSIKKELQFLIHPRSVKIIKIDGKRVPHEVMRSTNVFLITYLVIFSLSVLLVALNGFDFETSVTAVVATLNNTGPGLGGVGPASSFGALSAFSKVVLMFNMLAGRLEVFPILLLFSPGTWRRQ